MDFFETIRKIGEMKQNGKQLPITRGHFFLSDGSVLAYPRTFGNTRQPYLRDGMMLWAYGCGYFRAQDGAFNIFPEVNEGDEPHVAFFATVRGETVALLGMPILEEPCVRSRYTVFADNAVYYFTEIEGLTFVLRAFISEDKELHFSLAILPDSFRVTVSNIDLFDETLAQIKAVPNVDTVRESQEIVNQISTLQKSITLICVVLVAVLIVVSLLIIANTIRITMASRKIDIQVMKSVGATNAFISWPFMIEGIFIGFVSGLLAMGLTYVLQVTEGDALSSLFGLFGSHVFSITNYLPYFVGGYIIAGVLLGSFGSVVSLLRYLKKEGSESANL